MKISKKLIPIILIFTMTFGNFAFVGKAYASSFFGIFSNKGDTGSANVEFEASFVMLNEDAVETEAKAAENKTLQASETVDEEAEEETNESEDEVETEAEPEQEEEAEETDTEQTESEETVTEEDEDEQDEEEEEKIEEGETEKKEDDATEEQEVEDDQLEAEEESEPEEEEELVTSVTANVNETDLALKFKVKVLNDGYLKDAKILLGNGDELNFELNLDNFENENLQNFENNNMELIQLNADTEIEIIIPIYYGQSEYTKLDYVSKSNIMKFEGVYVEDDDETEVSKEVALDLSWEDNRNIKINSEVTKYMSYSINGESGVILQVIVNSDNTTDKNILPVKSSKLEVEVPKISDTLPETIKIVANSLSGVTEKEIDEVELNPKYDENSNILSIELENEAELVRFQDEDDVLIDETIPEVEAYYTGGGVNEYIITYVYNGIELENVNLTSNINSSYSIYGGTTAEAQATVNYDLKNEIGDVATFSATSDTESISKAYTYLNYNNDNKYEMEIDNKLTFNISQKDIVKGLYYEDTQNCYITNDGMTYNQNDVYYKSLKINQNNFNEILGDDGYINLYDMSDNLIYTINNETDVTDEANYEIAFENEAYYGIKIETSDPISEGNLNIYTVRAYKGVSYNKAFFQNVSSIQLNSVAKVKYEDIDDYVDCGTGSVNITLEDTKSDAQIVVGQETLSTLTVNENVEIKIELNNDKDTSDIYGNSEFIVKMPSYVEDVEVTNYSLLYGEGLKFSSLDVYEENGSMYLRMNLTETQEAISSGLFSNGTNIIVDVNIKVNLYTPATIGIFELTYRNDEATGYENSKDGIGYSNTSIKYSAPSGVVAVNSISNYNEAGDTVSSVRQGIATGNLDLNADPRNATMELIIMNNEENNISDVSILGRTIFEGNTDLLTGEDLETTLTAPMISGITSDIEGFTIYYSTNGDATNDLNDDTNGWTTDVSNWNEIKSYLIIPNDANYELGQGEKLHFEYTFTIPGNLERNETLYGTFAVYYTNKTDVANLNEVSIPDLVGLTTGIGPTIEVTTELSNSEVTEYEQFEYKTIVSNTGRYIAENIEATVPIPSELTYVDSSATIDDIEIEVTDTDVIYKIAELDVGESIEITTIFEANRIFIVSSSDEEEDDNTSISVDTYTDVTCDNLDTTISSDIQILSVDEAEMQVEVYNYYEDTEYISEGSTIDFYIYPRNLTDDDLKNAVVTVKLDSAFTFVSGTILEYDENINSTNETEIAKYDEGSRTVTWKIKTLDSLYTPCLTLTVELNELSGSSLSKEATVSATAYADGTKTYSSAESKIKIGKASLTVTQKTNTNETYVKERDTIEYVFTIKNNGTVGTSDAQFIDYVPEGLAVIEMYYKFSDGEEVDTTMYKTEEAAIYIGVSAGGTMEVKVTAEALELTDVSELTVTNYGVATYANRIAESNSITHIIEGNGNEYSSSGNGSSESSTEEGEESVSSSSNSVSSSSRTYTISGVAWLDENENGVRDTDEKLLEGITVSLVDSDGATIKQTTETDSKGEYLFDNVESGNYIVMFDYDTKLYTVTTYQKENIELDVNSDVVTTKVEENEYYRNSAVTDVITISDNSATNIDIGLINAMKFDLSLDMGITKVTVQNSAGTKTKEYDNVTYTKTEISQRNLEGSEIYVEYSLKITNEGEISGYATSIVDYIPAGMNFNSSMNSDWYTGSDGNIYTNAFEETEIAPGETIELTLVLSKVMTEENTGTVSNTAEIANDYNIYGVDDVDSVPGNNNQSEDDFARADIIMGVATGLLVRSIPFIIVIGLVALLIVLSRRAIKLKEKQRKFYV